MRRFSNQDYSMVQDQLVVPLRQTVEHLGGQIEWQADRETAVVRLGLQRFEFKMQDQLVKQYSATGKIVQQKWGNMQMEEGRIKVPLRELLGLLDYEIVNYAAESKTIERWKY